MLLPSPVSSDRTILQPILHGSWHVSHPETSTLEGTKHGVPTISLRNSSTVL
jgi:hypothetical protein